MRNNIEYGLGVLCGAIIALIISLILYGIKSHFFEWHYYGEVPFNIG